MKVTKKTTWFKCFSLLLAGIFLLSGCGNANNTGNEEQATASPANISTDSEDSGDQDAPSSGFDIESAEIIRPVVLAEAEGTDFPVEDVLTPIWHEKTKLIPEYVVVPSGQDLVQYFQMQVVAGTLPEIIALPNGVAEDKTVFDFLKSQNLVRDITLDDIYTYMPRFVEKTKAYWGDITIEDWVVDNSDIRDGKLYYFPQGPFSALLDLDYDSLYRDPVAYSESYRPYCWYFRDDILKMIFPEAKSEKELRQLVIDNGGTLTYEDVDDVPIKNMEDLYNYLTKVKELNLTVDGKPITPMQLQSSSAPDSVWWSTVSLYDQHWQGEFLTSDDSFTYFASDPDWKEYLRWFNLFFNEGLIGQETFIQSDDQRDAKVANGEYAVFQFWLPVIAARETAKEYNRDYGFRKVALFIDDNSLVNEYQDFSKKTYSLNNNWGSAVITTALPDEHWGQVLNWIDWNYSMEADELRAWGIPEFYTGDGMDRRFKPEYKDLEKWVLYGETGGKDGIYYGMKYENIQNSVIGSRDMLYSPANVYPQDFSDPANMDIDYYYDYAIRKYFFDKMTLYINQSPDSEEAELQLAYEEALEEFNKNIKPDLGYTNNGGQTAIVKAIVGSVADFEKNYAAFEEAYMTPEFDAEIDKLRNLYIPYSQKRATTRKEIQK